MKHAKTRTFIRRFSSFVLAAALCAGIAVPAFAAGSPINGGMPNSSLNVKLVKDLKMGNNTPTPAAAFKFAFTKVSYATDRVTTPTGNMNDLPHIGNPADPSAPANGAIITGTNYTFAAADGSDDPATGIKTATKTDWVLPDPNVNYFPAAGVYVYNVEEVPNTYTIADPALETMNYSPAKYKLTFHVYDGLTVGTTYVGQIVAEIVTLDGSHDSTTTSAGDKVQELTFTNDYAKTLGKVIADETLGVSKVVANSSTGTPADQSQYFPFSVTVQKPASLTTAPTYKAYVVNSGSNTNVTSTSNYGGTLKTDPDITSGNDLYIEFTPDQLEVVRLKHGQTLRFSNLHIGATYEVQEAPDPDYGAELALTINGVGPTNSGSSTAYGQALSTGDVMIGGDGANTAAFKNTISNTPNPITGITIDNLPYVVLLVLALGSLTAYVIVKSRRQRAN